MVEIFNCKNVRVEDVTFENASGWTFRPIECDTVIIRGLKIRNPVIGPNTDGIDLTCCRNVSISDCDISTGDDAICLKSEGPYGVMGLSRNITITNCVLTCCCNGLKFGTATRGGYENITFTNSRNSQRRRSAECARDQRHRDRDGRRRMGGWRGDLERQHATRADADFYSTGRPPRRERSRAICVAS